jgi:hypothetical protein
MPYETTHSAVLLTPYIRERLDEYWVDLFHIANELGLESTLALERPEWIERRKTLTATHGRLWYRVEATWFKRRMKLLRAGYPEPITLFFRHDSSALTMLDIFEAVRVAGTRQDGIYEDFMLCFDAT